MRESFMKTRAVVRIYGGMLLLGMADLQFGDGSLIAIFGVIGLLGFVLGMIDGIPVRAAFTILVVLQ